MNQESLEQNMFVEERKKKIIELLNLQGKIVVPELCDMFGVSASTIRGDLRQLEAEHLLKRTHGGAVSNTKAGRELLPSAKEFKMMRQKEEIALAALNLIEDGDVIAVTTGTTTFELIKLLNRKKGLTVVLNDIHFAVWLEENTDFTVVFLGGIMRNHYHYVTSPVKSRLLELLNIDKIFFSCNGFGARHGVTTPDLESALCIRDVLDKSYTSYLLSDSSKYGTATFAKIADLKEISAVITDSGMKEEDYGEICSVTDVILAPAGSKIQAQPAEPLAEGRSSEGELR